MSHCIFSIFQIQQLEVFNFIKIEALAQVFSCEFCKIFNNTFFTEHLRTTASDFFHWITI